MFGKSHPAAQFPTRQCEHCKCRAEAIGFRQWKLNGLIPLGKTVNYQCIVCQERFELRTWLHLALLSCALAYLLYAFDILLTKNLVVQFIMGAVGIYTVYALVSDSLNRWKNPVWQDHGLDA